MLITIFYFLGCCCGMVSGVLLFFSPEKYWRFLNSFVVVGKVLDPDPKSASSRSTRFTGLLLALFSLWMAVVPVLRHFSPNGTRRQTPTEPAPAAFEVDWIAMLGITSLFLMGAFMVCRPAHFLRWATRRGAVLLTEDTKSSQGILWIRVIGAILLVFALYFANAALRSLT